LPERIEPLSDITYVTLRYCGQTSGRPWERHWPDLYKSSLKTWLAQFHKTVGMMCPGVLTSVTVHTVTGAQLIIPLAAETLDLREQALIALFGDNVLNTEFGGKNIIVLTEEDHSAFNALRTDFVSLSKKLLNPSNNGLSRIEQYSKAVQAYASKTPTTTTGDGKVKHSFTNETAEMIATQGTFRVLSDGAAFMVTFGSDIGDTHEEDDNSFFEAGGRSADIVCYIYNHFAHWEAGVLTSFNDGITKLLAKAGCLPFADVFPWVVKHRNDYKKAGQLLAKYMRCINPYVVLTYGNLVR
jgi:hypothetical protein